MLNKKSRRLFNRVYSLGGSVQNYYSQMNSNDLRPELRAESDLLGANLTTDKQLVDALKTIPTSVWLDYSFINLSTVRTREPTWVPVIESLFFCINSIITFFLYNSNRKLIIIQKKMDLEYYR